MADTISVPALLLHLHELAAYVNEDSQYLKDVTHAGDLLYDDQAELTALARTIDRVGVSKSLLMYANAQGQLSKILNTTIPAGESLTSDNVSSTKDTLLSAVESTLLDLQYKNQELFTLIEQYAKTCLQDMYTWRRHTHELDTVFHKALKETEDKSVSLSVLEQLAVPDTLQRVIDRNKDNLEMIYNYTELNGETPDLHTSMVSLERGTTTATVDKNMIKTLRRQQGYLYMLYDAATTVLKKVVEEAHTLQQIEHSPALVKERYYKLMSPVKCVASINKFYTTTTHAIMRVLLDYIRTKSE